MASWAGVLAGWNAPVQEDLDVLWVIPHLLDQLLQGDGYAWGRLGAHSKAEDDPVDVFRLVESIEI